VIRTLAFHSAIKLVRVTIARVRSDPEFRKLAENEAPSSREDVATTGKKPDRPKRIYPIIVD